jgi:hypothetical protein
MNLKFAERTANQDKLLRLDLMGNSTHSLLKAAISTD